MKRRNFVKSTAVGASFVLLNNATSAHTDAANTTEITHYVLFWLKKDLSEQEIINFVAFFDLLKTIPEVKSLKYGRAAKTNKRDVVDNSFTYNLVATFNTLKDIAVYETHPIHLNAIKKYSNFWEKVIVHDSCIA